MKNKSHTKPWPLEVWSLLLQCKLSGKAQEVVAALSLEESLKYNVVKATVLRAYELVPEAYRQRFRNHKKALNQTFVEFARDKESLFDRWCSASKVTDFAGIRELILLEDFKNTLPERQVVHLCEQKVATLAQAAVLVDEYTLTHKSAFTPPRVGDRTFVPSVQSPARPSPTSSSSPKDVRECFYCHQKGHLIATCPVLSNRDRRPMTSGNKPKGVGLVCSKRPPVKSGAGSARSKPDRLYSPFLLTGLVSLSGMESDQRPIQILRDTGAAQSVILTDALPWSSETSCGSQVLMQGIEMRTLPLPLHWVHLTSDLVSGHFRVGVMDTLPVKGVTLLLGNDIAGGKVTPLLEVLDKPNLNSEDEDLSKNFPNVFSACVVTRAQSRRLEDVVSLSEDLFDPVAVESEVPHEPARVNEVHPQGDVVDNWPQSGDLFVAITPETNVH